MNNSKICTHCNIIKNKSEFPPNKYHTDKLNSWCRECCNLYAIQKRKTHPEYQILYDIKKRCTNSNDIHFKNYGERGIEYNITIEEIRLLMKRDKYWELNNPSIDRKDNNGNYTFDNCRFIEREENSAKDKRKSVLQYTLEGKFIKEWSSAAEIERQINIHHTDISKVCLGKQNKAKGFIFKFKE